MAPLVIAQDPDLTDSEEEKKIESKSTESVQEETTQLVVPVVPSSAEISTEIQSSTVASSNKTNEQTNPWDGPPAEEPVYPPGTFRGIF